MPAVSIVIPTYRRPEYLRRAVRSVIEQTFQDWELVIAMRLDGAQDLTREVAMALKRQDPRIRAVECFASGAAASRNFGASNTSGSYLAFLDDDDEWLPHKLRDQVEFLDGHPEAGMVYGRIEIYRMGNDGLKKTSALPHFLATRFDEMFRDDFWITPTVTLLRTACFQSMGGFDTRYVIGEDWECWLRFSQRWKMAAVDKSVAKTIKDGHVSLSGDQIKSAQQGIQILRDLELLTEFKKYRPLVRRHLARLCYRLGKMWLEAAQFQPAAENFIFALKAHPLVGLHLRNSSQTANPLMAVVKSYLAAPACLVKGLLHAKH